MQNRDRGGFEVATTFDNDTITQLVRQGTQMIVDFLK